MENIITSGKESDRNTLALTIIDLEDSIDYQGFRIRLEDTSWIEVEQKGKRTELAIFGGLSPTTRYKSFGEIKVDGIWKEVHSPTIQTSNSDKQNRPPKTDRHATGLIISDRHGR